ncbi:hypothetical protein K439DRAFT_1620188 [Ramaria rubella]|nr:hypothetical protein K439DRAFT_1620188 [Ramaria rubella]
MLSANDEPTRDAPQTSAEQEVVKSCLEIVNEHRNGTIDRSRAVLRLTGILQGPECETALVRYLDQIHETEHVRATGKQRGKQVEFGRSQSTLNASTDHGVNAGDKIRPGVGEHSSNDAGLWKRPNVDFAEDDANPEETKQQVFIWMEAYLHHTNPC